MFPDLCKGLRNIGRIFINLNPINCIYSLRLIEQTRYSRRFSAA